MTSFTKRHHVVEKVTCGKCLRFMGIISSDGTGPIFDGCPEKDRACPMREYLEPYQPKTVPLNLPKSTRITTEDMAVNMLSAAYMRNA